MLKLKNILNPKEQLQNNILKIATKCIRTITFWSDTNLLPYLMNNNILEKDPTTDVWYYKQTASDGRKDIICIGKECEEVDSNTVFNQLCDDDRGLDFRTIKLMYDNNGDYSSTHLKLTMNVEDYSKVYEIYNLLIWVSILINNKKIDEQDVISIVYNTSDLIFTIKTIFEDNQVDISSHMAITLDGDEAVVTMTDDKKEVINEYIERILIVANEMYEVHNEY